MGQNYFNSLPLRLQLQELGQCRFMDASEFDGVEALPCSAKRSSLSAVALRGCIRD